jgi:hypothetical protein
LAFDPYPFLDPNSTSGSVFGGQVNQVFVSNTLQEDYVGLEEVDDGIYDMYFCYYQIGRYELRKNKIHDVVSRVGLSRRQVDLATRV